MEVVLAVIAGNVAMMGLVKALSDRLGDVVTRMDRADARHDVVMARLDGLSETVARLDERNH